MDALLNALGLKPDEHRITNATLNLRAGHILTMDVSYIILDKDIPAIAEALKKYKLVVMED